ncbi:DNA-binding transcriptional LysR family regulator [Curtobacterium luteum]|uniref:DNA-binding transcriptional LysR family regulator n=1 Tax=Curtobacterium luteum TaxID=33881 RepID=A0A8H9L051_9MICO|nr:MULTISPECIES: LysR family transcriptional regulator [Curtobacterium]MBM7801272.1 DNA-binding transcriptional LysR family regulator [Curtobacterium luteum]NUU51178.1 LysR family transcriptional regulator [Curtobacterium luteum]GGK95558.1 LysR family transcriptional regulator [Curtobacterium luteum]
MDEIDPQLLRVLRAVRDAGSISRAAVALGYSQPAVSQLLARAERRLGHDLVLRGARGVTLTEPGRVLAEHAPAVEAALAAAREDLDAVGGLARGRVRIAGFPSASSTLVPAVLATMAHEAPGVVTSYVEAEPPEAVELLRRGEVDVALTFSHALQDADPGVDPTLLVRVLGQDPLALVTPATTDTVTAVGPADLAEHREARWIGGCPRCRGHLLASCAASGFTPDIVLETDNAAAVVGLVAAGLGVALLPRLALRTTVVPAGVTVTPAGEELARRVEVVVARGADRVPSVRAALGAVRSAAHLLG